MNPHSKENERTGKGDQHQRQEGKTTTTIETKVTAGMNDLGKDLDRDQQSKHKHPQSLKAFAVVFAVHSLCGTETGDRRSNPNRILDQIFCTQRFDDVS